MSVASHSMAGAHCPVLYTRWEMMNRQMEPAGMEAGTSALRNDQMRQDTGLQQCGRAGRMRASQCLAGRR